MTYWKENQFEFLRNGNTTLRVETLAIIGDIYNPGRFGRIFLVRDVKQFNPRNPIFPGSQICVSFPPDKINARKYSWSTNEPRQIPLKMKKVAKPTSTEQAVEKL